MTKIVVKEDDINKLNLFVYYSNNSVMGIDNDGHLNMFAKLLIGGGLIIGAIALTVATSGLGSVIAGSIGGNALVASIAGGAISGAVVGAASVAMIDAGKQISKKGFENFDWKSVGKSALTGLATGAIAGGIFGGIQYGFSSTKIANTISNLKNAETN